jgi:hypothetical protein
LTIQKLDTINFNFTIQKLDAIGAKGTTDTPARATDTFIP